MIEEVKPVPPTIDLIDRTSEEGKWITAKVGELVERWHTRLHGALFTVVWKLNWNEDRQGNTPLGALKVLPELFWRLMAVDDEAPDFVLLLNSKLWKVLLEKQKTYILDELLCYGSPRVDKNGDQATNEDGRALWRTLKPQFSGFAAPIRRHGPQLKQIKAFLKDARRGHQEELEFDEPVPGERPGAPDTVQVERENSLVHYYTAPVEVDGDMVQLRFNGPEHHADQLDGVCHLTVENAADSQDGLVRDAGKLTYNEDPEVLLAFREFLEDSQADKVAAAPVDPAPEGVEQPEPEEEDDDDAVVSVPTRGRGRPKSTAPAAAAEVH